MKGFLFAMEGFLFTTMVGIMLFLIICIYLYIGITIIRNIKLLCRLLKNKKTKKTNKNKE